MIVYPPIFYGAELKLVFKGKLTWKVADTLQYYAHTWCARQLKLVGYICSVKFTAFCSK